MKLHSYQVIRFQYILVFLTLASALFILACSGDQEPAFVDFSKKAVENKYPENPPDTKRFALVASVFFKIPVFCFTRKYRKVKY